MQKLYFFLASFLFVLSNLWAQPSNDECINAIPLNDVTNWCSAIDEFTTVNATESSAASPQCFPNNQTPLDVWFSFVAEGSGINISVIGDTQISPGGTLNDPQVALYDGNCTNLNLLACNSDNTDAGQIGIIQAELMLGETYYIRISGRFGNTGTFKLCANSYASVPLPDGDCPTAVILCDRSPFAVQQLEGVGVIPNEIGNVSCSSITCNLTESSSTWYKWICDEAGPLAFTLTPNNPSDDLDFIVYELPNGLDDCANKTDIRCMASGENVGAPLSEWIACTGATGLSTADNDDSETCGCQAGDNNFARAVDMVAGRAYALVVNNFSPTGNGFSIEFDQSPGTGTFLGPTANFTFQPSQVCVGEPVTFTDASTFVGNIESYTWNFGSTASPSVVTGIGPHQVVFNTPGTKSAVLEITSERGCIVTKIEIAAEVVCCDDHYDVSADITDVDCPDSVSGVIDFSVANDFGPYGFTWSNGAQTEDIAGLLPDTYTVTVVDESGCEGVFPFTVSSPPPFTFDTLVTMPTCNGGTDGAVTLVVNGGTPPYEYNWDNAGFGTSNTLTNLSSGNYTVIIRDANDCELTQVLAVRELELLLDPSVQAITQPSCFGFNDGAIEIVINNGQPPYTYNFNDGNGFTNANALNNLTAGIYQVNVLDANLCEGFFNLEIEDHPPLVINLEPQNISCFGESDGHINANVEGGFGSYFYNWSNGVTTQLNDGLIIGDYSVTVVDENSCEITASTSLTQPDSLGLDLIEVIDNICFGESNGSITVAGIGGTPPFEYSLDGDNFQVEPVFNNLITNNYEVVVLDALGCTATVMATVVEPPELIVEAGPDILLQLGYDTTALAISNYSPVSYEWTPLDSLQCLNTDCSFINLNPTSTTTYQVLVTNEAACTAIDSVTVYLVKDRPYYIPNIFSPNNDGNNDGFTVFGGPGLEEIEKLQVFSRWGSLVFEASNILPNTTSLGWDGTFKGEPLNSDVFVYIAQLRFVDKEVILAKGDVTVLR